MRFIKIIVSMLAMLPVMVGCAGEPFQPAPCMPPSLDVHGSAGAATDGVRVQEDGFTALPDVRQPDHVFVSFGAILVNVSDRVAYRTHARLRLRDDHGRELAGPDPWLQIPMILPGQRVPFGDWHRLPGPVRLTAVVLELGSTTWLDPDPERFRPMAAAVTATEPGTLTGTGTTLHYEAESPYCWNLVAQGMAAVFRGPSGHIVGGGLMAIGECRSGPRSGSGAVVAVPPDAAPQRTQLYPYCDLIGPSTNVWGA